MPDWMRPESMTITVLTYRGLTSGRLFKTPAMSTDVHHQNAVFIRNMRLGESLKHSIRRRLIAHGMDSESPVFDVTTIWDSGPVVELAELVDDIKALDPPEIQEPMEVKPKKQLTGIVSGSLDGIRAQFGRDNGQD